MFEKSRKNVYCLLVINKQFSFLRYFKKFLLGDFSKYFCEGIIKLSIIFKRYNFKNLKKAFSEKVFGTFTFLGSFKYYHFCHIKNLEVSKYVLQNTFYFCTFSNIVIY